MRYDRGRGSLDRHATYIVATFLAGLREAGLAPAEVITDGAPRYPGALARVWPAAAHQLCLFHEARRVTSAVGQIIKEVRAAIPAQPAQRPPHVQAGQRTRDHDDDRHQRVPAANL